MSVVFTDLDGTMLNNDSIVSEYTKNVIREMLRTGHKLVLSSGRPLPSVLEVKEKAGLDFPNMYVIAFNGCIIYDCDKKEMIHTVRVPRKILKEVWELAGERNLHIQTYTDDSIVVPDMDKEIAFYTRLIHMDTEVTTDPASTLKDEPYKMLAISLDDRKKIEAFRDEVVDKYGDELAVFFSNNWYLEMFKKESGKGSAVKWMCEHFGVPLADSYAFGDEMNDESMLLAAGHGIAMKNSNPNLFASADEISEYTNHEDGFAKYIEKHIL